MLTSKALRFEGRVNDLPLMFLNPLQILQNVTVASPWLKKARSLEMSAPGCGYAGLF